MAQRTKFFSRQNAFKNLFAKRTIEAPVRSIWIRSIGNGFTDVELTSTSSRGRVEFETRKSTTRTVLAELFIWLNAFTSHDKVDRPIPVSAETILDRDGRGQASYSTYSRMVGHPSTLWITDEPLEKDRVRRMSF
jgi:hypothetical protein